MLVSFLGILIASTGLVYVQDKVDWTIECGLPKLVLVIALGFVFAGTPFYRRKLPQGSPLTKMAEVMVAALRKWRVPIPTHPEELHELDME